VEAGHLAEREPLFSGNPAQPSPPWLPCVIFILCVVRPSVLPPMDGSQATLRAPAFAKLFLPCIWQQLLAQLSCSIRLLGACAGAELNACSLQVVTHSPIP